MTNAKERIISAFVLVLLLVTIVLLGKLPALLAIGGLGILVVDELFCNFFKRPRWSPIYFLTIILFILPLTFIHSVNHFLFYPVLATSLFINWLLLTSLFSKKLENNFFIFLSQKAPYLVSFMYVIPFSILMSVTSFPNWIQILVLLLLVNFSMDTGAWFFGSRWGKRKLWPAVSPKKTVEGTLGGMVTASMAGCGYSFFVLPDFFGFKWGVAFFVLAGLSQLGDLIQSKLKRQFLLKDSSNLIPGHGGVYDRLDSLIYVTPFFLAFLLLLGQP